MNSSKTKELTAQAVFDKAFDKNTGRAPRSEAYKKGVIHCLQVRVNGQSSRVKCPYAVGTAECDAYFAGIEEGRALSPIDRAPSGFDDLLDQE